jgi:hypothetical protein
MMTSVAAQTSPATADGAASGRGAKPPRPAVAAAEGRPERFCPICSSQMGPFDKLYGEIYKAEPRDKVFIKGCPRCVALPGVPSSRPDHPGTIDL